MHLLIKTLITIEGVGRRLDPELNIFDNIGPFAKKLIQSRLSPKKLVKDIYLATLDMTMLIKDLPFELHELAQIFFGFRLHQTEEFEREFAVQ